MKNEQVKEIIQLPSRYPNVDNHLIPVSKNKYKFYTSGESYRFGPGAILGKMKMLLDFIDPEGGPFIAKGYRISNYEEVISIVQELGGIYILTKDV